MSLRQYVFTLSLLVGAVPLFAQIDKASIDATVLDGNRAPISGVRVALLRNETGLQFEATTDASGMVHFPALAPGQYEVDFSAEGFSSMARRDLGLRVGQSIRLTVQLEPKISRAISVDANVPMVDLHKSDSSTNIVPEQIASLPVPDRDFQRLAFIAPGVERERGLFRFVTGGPVIGAGGNASHATIFVDGVDFTDPALGLSRTRFSQDAIREFRVIQNRFDSEIGGSAGGALSIVTKSGTNEVTGSVFGFMRDNSLRQSRAFETGKSDYSRQQYGFAVGAPLLRDRLFYFASAEEVHEQNLTLFRPGGGFAASAKSLEHPFDQTLLFASINEQFRPSMSASARFVYEGYEEKNFRVGGVADQSYGQQLKRRNWNGTFEHFWSLSSNTFNDARGQVGSHRYEEPTNSHEVGEWFSSGNTLMTGSNILGDLLGSGTTWEVRDTLHRSVVTGRSSHLFKAGLSAQQIDERSRIDTYQNGLFIYLTDTRAIPLAYAYGVGSADVKKSTQIYGAFLEDSWSASPKLQMNLGVRYDLDTEGNNPGFEHPLVQGRHRDTRNLQPRASFNYDVLGNGSQVLRGGAGRFTGRFLLVPALQEMQQNGQTGRVTYTRLNGALFGLPALALDPAHPTTTGIPSKPSIILLASDFKAPQSDQLSLGYTTRIAASRLFLDGEAIYVRGKNEVVVRDVNWRGNDQPGRWNPAYDQINQYTNDGHSTYKALVVSLNGNVRQNDLLAASLTIADKKNISDDFSPEFPFGYPNDPAHIEGEYGRSRGTERYRFVVSSIVHAPFGLTIAPIYEYGSGQPWTRRLGYDFNGDGKNSDRAAGVGRNSMHGAPFRQLSLRLTKSVPAASYGVVEVIAEAFNVTGVRNYDVSSIDAAEFLRGPTLNNPNAAAVSNPNYGKYRATLPAREIQLGLRWSF